MEKRSYKKHWTKEKCQEVSLKCVSRSDFKKKYKGSYESCRVNNWLDDVCSHMEKLKKDSGYWTKEKCHNESLKYNTKIDFQKYSPVAYKTSIKNKWIDDICKHMIRLGNRKHKCIYSYEFSDNSVYIGLTYHIIKRMNDHKNDINSSVFKHIEKTNISPTFKQLTDYVNVDIAVKLEGEYVQKYKDDGWNILNKAKTGSIGGVPIKWTKEKCLEEALKYNSKKELRKENKTVYNTCLKNKFLNEVIYTIKL